MVFTNLQRSSISGLLTAHVFEPSTCQLGWHPSPQPTDAAQHNLVVGIVDELDGVCRAFPGAGAASLALSSIDIGCTTQPTHTAAALLLDYLGDLEWACACAGQAANALLRIHDCHYPTQI